MNNSVKMSDSILQNSFGYIVNKNVFKVKTEISIKIKTSLCQVNKLSQKVLNTCKYRGPLLRTLALFPNKTHCL